MVLEEPGCQSINLLARTKFQRQIISKCFDITISNVFGRGFFWDFRKNNVFWKYNGTLVIFSSRLSQHLFFSSKKFGVAYNISFVTFAFLTDIQKSNERTKFLFTTCSWLCTKYVCSRLGSTALNNWFWLLWIAPARHTRRKSSTV